MRHYRVFMLLCKSFFVVFSILAVFFFFKNKNFLDHSAKAKATITEIDMNECSDGKTYSPYFEFKDSKGKLIRGKGRVSSENPDTYKKGEYLNILYLPDNPESCCIDSFFNIWLGTFICSLVAVFSLMDIGIIYLLKKLRLKLFPQ